MSAYSFGRSHPTVASDAYIAPSAVVIGDVVIGAHSSVWFNAVIRGDAASITIGGRSNIQDGCILHVDEGQPIVVEDSVTIGHAAVLHGCRISTNVLVGIKAVVLNGARISSDTIIAAGAVVPEDKEFPSGVLLLGVPARVARQLREEELAAIRKAATVYVHRADSYRNHLVIDCGHMQFIDLHEQPD